MALLDAFPEIVHTQESLAPFTHLKIGGPAEYLVHPRSVAELIAVLRECRTAGIPLRLLGNGGNLLVPDEGVKGVVIRLSHPAFSEITLDGNRIRAGCGAPLSAVISHAANHSLSGLEVLVGIHASVGGAVRCNSGDRAGEIGTFVRRVQVLNESDELDIYERDELRFAEHQSNIDDPVILWAEFELERDSTDAIVKRMRRAWIQRKASQPYSFQSATRMFRNPRGQTATHLIDQAGLGQTRVGGAELSDRNSNYLVTQPRASARDVLRLIDLVRSKVQEKLGVQLEQELIVW